MSDSVQLPGTIALSTDLTSVELGVYVRCKALIRREGRKAFSIADIGKFDGEELARSAIDRLLELSYVVHKGGGWYSLARRPVTDKDVANTSFMKKLISGAERAKQTKSKKDGKYEELADALLVGIEKAFNYKPSKMMYTTSDPANRACYRKIIGVVNKFGSSIKEFVWFVLEHDWKWLNQPAPGPRILGSNNFLGSFESYLQNRVKLNGSSDVFDAYDRSFGTRTARGLAEMRTALLLKNALSEINTSPAQFFSYASSIRWATFGGTPPLSFLASDRFVKQFKMHIGSYSRQPIIEKHSYYLSKVLTRLEKVPRDESDGEFENYNWQVAEAIFEPLCNLTAKGETSKQLTDLTVRARDEKHLPTFGSYVVTREGKFTPLAVYWIVYAATHLGTLFCPPAFGNWKTTVESFSDGGVNLEVLGMSL